MANTTQSDGVYLDREKPHGDVETSKVKGQKQDVILLQSSASEDVNNPMNWSKWKKNRVLAIWSFAAFSSQASAMANLQGYFLQAPVYNKTPVEVSYSISAALAGLIAGAILVVPLSRKFGSCFCLFWSSLGVLLTGIWSGLMTSPGDYYAFVASRLIAGICASVPLILGSEVVLRIFPIHQRGRCFHILHIPYLLGVVVGPTLGGYIVSDIAWPVQFWWTVGTNGVLVLLILLFLENTEYDGTDGSESSIYASSNVALLKRRAKTYLLGGAVTESISLKECAAILVNEFVIGLCPVSIMIGLFQLVDFGFATMSYVLNIVFLEDTLTEGGYGFDPMQTASFTLSQWIGLLLAEIYGHLSSDRLPLWLSRRHGHTWKPEYRLHCLWVPAIILPIGLGLFASALQYHLHWVVLAIGSVFISAAGMSVVPIAMTYVCECFPDYVSETSAIMGAYRLGFGLSTTFFATPWIDAVGVGWVFGMAALFTIPAFLLIIVLIWKGSYVRALNFCRVRSSKVIEPEQEGTRVQ